MILDLDVAGEGAVVGEDRVVADDAVVSDVGADHEEVAAADGGQGAAGAGAAVDRHVLAEAVVVADLEPRLLAAVLQVLGVEAPCAPTAKLVAASTGRRTTIEVTASRRAKPK